MREKRVSEREKYKIDFADFAAKLTEADNCDKALRTIAEEISRLYPNSIVLIAEKKSESENVKFKEFIGNEKKLEKVSSFLNSIIENGKADAHKLVLELLKKRTPLAELDVSLAELCAGKGVSENACSIIRKSLKLKKLAFLKIGQAAQKDIFAIIFLAGEDELRAEDATALSRISELGLGNCSYKSAFTEASEIYKFLFEYIDDIYYESTLDGKLLVINPRFAEIMEMPLEKIYKTPLFKFYKSNSDRKKLIESLKKNSIVRDYEIDLVNGKNKVVPFSISSKLVYDPILNEKKIVGSMRDISLRKKYENESKLYQEKLEKEIKTKDNFFSLVAHDLRSPLAGVFSLAALAKNTYEEFSKEEIKEIIDAIYSSVQDVNDFLENLLEWARIERNMYDLEIQTFDLSQLARELARQNRVSLSQKEIKAEIYAPKEIFVKSDPNIVNTITRNFLTNAIKFSPRGGKVDIIVEEDKANAFITVKDYGEGIPLEKIEHLFDFSKKITSYGSEGEKGAGFGLKLCKELSGLIGGDIIVKSEVGEGAAFTLKFAKNLKIR